MTVLLPATALVGVFGGTGMAGVDGAAGRSGAEKTCRGLGWVMVRAWIDGRSFAVVRVRGRRENIAGIFCADSGVRK